MILCPQCHGQTVLMKCCGQGVYSSPFNPPECCNVPNIVPCEHCHGWGHLPTNWFERALHRFAEWRLRRNAQVTGNEVKP